MGARFNSFLVVATAAVSVLLTSQLSAATTTEEPVQLVDHVENAPFQFIGQINTDNVHVRSGPGENHYATLRLNKGAQVTVMGIKFDWLKILPPEGSYSAIARQFVRLDPGSRTGVVTATNVNVRAAGNASNLKTMIQCQLNAGDVVTIVGEEDQYYQIKPPADAYAFINEKFVTPVRQINITPQPRQRRPLDPEPAAQPAPPLADGLGSPLTGPTTQPAGAGALAAAPTTQPARWDLAKIETEFDRLEALLRSASTQRLDEQPLGQLIAGYQGLMQRPGLPATMRQIAQVRLLTLQAKLKSQEEYLATLKMQQEADRKLAQLRAEREAVEQRMSNGITAYTAVGTLQASTLQLGAGTLYRLTDPSTGRTLCYVRSANNAKPVTFVNRFVGVKGELTADPQLSMKVIPATEITAVDPQMVNRTVVAQVVPPSLLSRTLSEKK